MQNSGARLDTCRLLTIGGTLLGCALGCQPSAFDELRGAQPAPGAERDGSVASDAELPDANALDAAVMGGGGLDAAGLDANVPDAEVLDGAAPPDAPPADPDPITAVLTIQRDEDDGFWYRPQQALVEKLHFEPTPGDYDDYSFEVGTDSEQCRAALRFALPIGAGATVLSANLRLRRTGPAWTAPASATMQVRVFQSANVGPLVEAHVHTTLGDHAADGLSSESVTGFGVGEVDTDTESPDLSRLVQRVLDRSDWQEGGYIGFVLLPDGMGPDSFAQFEDKAGDLAPATLTIRYRR